MIIEVEDRFCKAAKAFSAVLNKLQRSAEHGEAVHVVEEMSWSGLIEVRSGDDRRIHQETRGGHSSTRVD